MRSIRNEHTDMPRCIVNFFDGIFVHHRHKRYEKLQREELHFPTPQSLAFRCKQRRSFFRIIGRLYTFLQPDKIRVMTAETAIEARLKLRKRG